MAAALAAQGWSTEQVALVVTGEEVIGPVVEEVVSVLVTSGVLVVESVELVETTVEVGVGVVEVVEELETGTLVDTELPGETVVDVTTALVVVALVLVMAVADEAAAERHEQTLAAELRAASAVTKPHALVAQGSAVTTIPREIDEIHLF
jgi:hypothetical protein